jgi:glycosyltransferase involved in cell wall biosynthesis
MNSKNTSVVCSSTRVSIVVPAYDAEETIAETLSSLMAQTYANLEVIIVDDGSSDQTAEIAQVAASGSNGRMRYMQQENAGQSAALNVGWAEASGGYLGYLSADDVVYPDALATLADFLDRNPPILAVYPDYDLIDAESKVIRRVYAPNYDPREMVEQSVCQPGPAVLFRKEAFTRTGGWNCDFKQMPDFEFWLRLGRSGPMARLPRALAGFRVHDRSQSFAIPSETKSEEPVRLIEGFLAAGSAADWNAARAKAWAHVLSARLHVRAGRLRQALRHLRLAWQHDSSVSRHVRFWHLLGSGAFGRIRYRLTNPVSKRANAP